MEYKEIEKIVMENLSEKRFYHSKCVAKRCVELANRYNIDVEKAKLIGIVHDMAKEMPDEAKLDYIKHNNLQADEIEKEHPRITSWKNCSTYWKK